MNKALRKVFTTSSALLMLASVGVSTGNSMANAKVRHKRTHRVYRHRARKIRKIRVRNSRKLRNKRIHRNKKTRKNRYVKKHINKQNINEYNLGLSIGKKSASRMSLFMFDSSNQLIKNKRALNKSYDKGFMQGFSKAYKNDKYSVRHNPEVELMASYFRIQNAKTYLTTRNKSLKFNLGAYFGFNRQDVKKIQNSDNESFEDSKFTQRMYKIDPYMVIDGYNNIGAGDMGGSDELVAREDKMDKEAVRSFNKQANGLYHQFLKHRASYMFTNK